MSLRLEVTKRNYELEHIKHHVRAKQIALRDNPLSHLGGNEQEEEVFENENFGKEAENDNDAAGTTITHKLG